ncbi:MAG: hypothetical protein WBM50_01775, partial [Acidimicrobiales bacterium]
MVGDGRPSALTGPSIWWATPATPASYFTEEELARSRAYHTPLRRVGVASIAAKIALLIVAAVAAPDMARRFG